MRPIVQPSPGYRAPLPHGRFTSRPPTLRALDMSASETDRTTSTHRPVDEWHTSLLVIAAIGSFIARLLFWAYTGRIFEDAIITLTPARNAWEGYGLTHHVSEPRVHSFTSALSVLVPLVGEAFGRGIELLQLFSLCVAPLTIYFAARIAHTLAWGAPGALFLFAYLAFDQLQIFYGMAGMETQLATLTLFAATRYLLVQQWRLVGLWCGLGVLARPEFALLAVVYTGAALRHDRRACLETIVGSALPVLPWLLFTTAYFGSAIPQTIIAKNCYPNIGLSDMPSLSYLLMYCGSLLRLFTPFVEWPSARGFPVPLGVLGTVSSAFLIMIALGVRQSVAKDRVLLPVVLFTLGYFAYRILARVPTYFAWHVAPVMGLVALLAGAGIERWRRGSPVAGYAVALPLALAFSAHMPLSFPLERLVQERIEYGVRVPVGRYLDSVMSPLDTVALEPLGYIGWGIRPKTTYDYPGLSSPRVTDALLSLPSSQRTLHDIVRVLEPTFVVYRPGEFGELTQRYPKTAAHYRLLRTFSADPSVILERGGLVFGSLDREFEIYRRG
jgi:hypothetical protein